MKRELAKVDYIVGQRKRTSDAGFIPIIVCVDEAKKHCSNHKQGLESGKGWGGAKCQVIFPNLPHSCSLFSSWERLRMITKCGGKAAVFKASSEGERRQYVHSSSTRWIFPLTTLISYHIIFDCAAVRFEGWSGGHHQFRSHTSSADVQGLRFQALML